MQNPSAPAIFLASSSPYRRDLLERLLAEFDSYDERIPEDGFHWGLGVLYDVVRDFCG